MVIFKQKTCKSQRSLIQILIKRLEFACIRLTERYRVYRLLLSVDFQSVKKMH